MREYSAPDTVAPTALDTVHAAGAASRPAPAAARAPARPAADPARRLRSVDVFRGLAIAAMVLVNNPGDWNTVYAPLLHAPWHGVTPTDLVFPFFLFIVGAAITLSGTTALSSGRVLRRGAVIFGLGLFLSGFPFFNLATWRIPGVLQRIALCYVAAVTVLRLARPHEANARTGMGRVALVMASDPGRLRRADALGAGARRTGRRPDAGRQPRGLARPDGDGGAPVAAHLGSGGAAEHAAGRRDHAAGRHRRTRAAARRDRRRLAPPPAPRRGGRPAPRGTVASVVPDEQESVDELVRALHGRRRGGAAGALLLVGGRDDGSMARGARASRWSRSGATRSCCSCSPVWRDGSSESSSWTSRHGSA